MNKKEGKKEKRILVDFLKFYPEMNKINEILCVKGRNENVSEPGMIIRTRGVAYTLKV